MAHTSGMRHFLSWDESANQIWSGARLNSMYGGGQRVDFGVGDC